jgi:hypothetical protein
MVVVLRGPENDDLSSEFVVIGSPDGGKEPS